MHAGKKKGLGSDKISTFFVFLLTQFVLLIQGIIVNGLINVVITTLERRFGLESVTSGQIASSYDIGSLLTVIPVTYFGGRVTASKPRY